MGELAEAFSPDSNVPPLTGDLAGTVLVLHYQDGAATESRFLSASRVAFTSSGPVAAAVPEGECGYFAVSPRPGIYLVDMVTSGAPPTAVSLVLDRDRGIATRLTAVLPQSPDCGESPAARAARGDELTSVSAEFASAAIGAPFTAATPRHETTSELVGRRVEYTYSPTERYEHIYLNDRFYTWHCLSGSEKGLADTDRCHYLKLDDELYLFVWREKIIPTLGLVIADFKAMRTMGKIFGHGSAGPADFLVGARARLENVTIHGEAVGP